MVIITQIVVGDNEAKHVTSNELYVILKLPFYRYTEMRTDRYN
jgi:hypothetical protein